MPIIRVEMLAGRSVDQKREVAAVFTRELSRICGCSEESVHLIFDDVAKQDWAAGGKLISDQYPD